MTGRSALSVLQHLHRLAREQQADKLSDRECLERFRTQRDEDAFAVLVRRHGPMVRGVCRRMLSPPLRPNGKAQLPGRPENLRPRLAVMPARSAAVGGSAGLLNPRTATR